ncbi:MAG TPA: tyrosine--tRNA ligase [Mycobacteriales bacterium]|jgi:tyrosyl-tRNA synthetase|nr:tyrosine--tRNA ligase [Mycobacteriales bacterium]
MPTDILADLEWRGLIAQQTDPDGLRAALAAGPVTVYAGFDPTSDSLQAGNLVPLLTLRRFQDAGHRAIALAGGATGLIGDPGGRSTERSLNPAETVAAWTERIRGQLGRLVDLDAGLLENNYDWTAGVSALDFLRDVGKHFTVNYMLAKESVSSRLQGEGISYTEFTYMLLQAFDFQVLFDRHGCTLQVGGSDQWGNITAGIELIRRTRGAAAYGLTLPLVTTASGEKFGKSAGNAVWLDPAKTSPYAWYQFWLNVADADAVPFLKVFTFLDRPAIEALEAELAERPHARAAQRALAVEMTRMVHGEEQLAAVQRASEVLFGSGDVASLPPELLDQALAEVPRAAAPRDGLPALPQLLQSLGLAASASAARRLVQQGGVYVNGARVGEPDWQPAAADLLHGRFLVVRSGKRNYGLVTAE